MIWENNKPYTSLIIVLLVCTTLCNILLSQVYAEKISQDFTMTTNPWPMTVTAGKLASWPFSVSTTSTNPTQVRLSCFVPSPASCNLSQPTVFPNETVNVLFKTSLNSPNQFRVIVTGTGETISRSSAFTLNINSNLPVPITFPPFIPMVPLTLSPISQGFEASLAIKPIYTQGEIIEESMIIQNISNKTIPASGISGVVSIMSNGSKVFSDNFRTLYDVEPGSSIGESGSGISWNRGSWIIPSSLKPGWYEMGFILITKDIQQAQHGQIFFQLVNNTTNNAKSTILSIQPNSASNYTKIAVFTDKKEFLLTQHQDVPVKIFGNIETYQQQFPIILSLENPSGVKEDLKVYGTNRGDFQLIYLLPKNSLPGTYNIYVKYSGLEIAKTSFEVIHYQQETGSNLIPVWFKNPVRWWSDGSIDDSEFIQSLQFLLTHQLIKVPPTLEISKSPGEIPTWVKSNASLWAHNQISDTSFIETIEYLISVGMLKT